MAKGFGSGILPFRLGVDLVLSLAFGSGERLVFFAAAWGRTGFAFLERGGDFLAGFLGEVFCCAMGTSP